MPCPLQTAATSTFESLALLFAEDAPTAAQREVPLAHAMQVQFGGTPEEGAFAGTLVVAVTDDVAAALAANMLGIEPTDADAQARRDALGELANVVCGNVVPLLGGRAAVFHLAAPAALALPDALAQLGTAEALAAQAHAAEAHTASATDGPFARWTEFGVEGGRAALAVYVPAGLPPGRSAALLLPTPPAASHAFLP